MPSYKLTYFSGRGFAEPTRMIFAQAGVEFEDVRMTRETWPALKETGKAPFGQLPILEVDGQVISQSATIMRFVAEQLGLSPSTSLGKAQANMIVDSIMGDAVPRLMKFHFEKDEVKKEEAKKAYFEVFQPQYFGFLENLLKNKDGAKDHFVGDELTYADIHFFAFFNSFMVEGRIETPKELADFPHLLALYNGVMELPNIRKWMETRPESEF